MNAALPIAMGVTVRPASTGDAVRWDAFVAACDQATFFHRFAWREIYESVFKHRTHYLLAERHNEVVGVLPLVELRSL
ncbi:MAG TPA: peptidoglycan bridge formation protein FemAB, partial [Burkholderiaceae bacterium]